MIMLLVLILIGIGCGQEPYNVDISNTTIVWQGYANEDSNLLARFDETMSCLNMLGVNKTGYPYVIVVQDTFLCGSNQNASGCWVESSDIVYITSLYFQVICIGLDVFKHEAIHWATRLGNEAHDTIYFTQCQNSTSL
jgi:hypothetical protein